LALWALFLLGAPFAGWLALELHEFEKARRRLTIDITKDQAIAIARKQAAELAVDVNGWQEYVSFDYNEELALYAHSRLPRGAPGSPKGAKAQMRGGGPPPGGPPPGAGPDRRRGPPPSGINEIRALLIEPSRNRFFRVRMNSRGRVVGWQLGGPGAAQSVPPEPPQVAKQLAEETFARWLGELEAERLGEPEMQRNEDVAGASGYEFTWRARNPRLPDTEYAVAVQVQGRRTVSLNATLNFSEAYRESVLRPRESIVSLINTLRTLLLVACVAYAFWRYTRRWLEGEAPHRRVLSLAAAFAFSGILILFLDNSFMAPQMEQGISNPGIEAVIVISSVAMFVLMGLMLGISYGSGEGEIREAFPGKMTAADCFLTGRIYNRNVGRSIVIGSAVMAWCFLLLTGISALITSEPPHVPEAQMGYAFGKLPILLLLFNVPVGGIFVVVTGLLLPLTFLRRHIRRRSWMIALLVGGALVGSNLYESPQQGYWNYIAEVVPLSLALLAAFFLGDLLASVVACAGLSMLSLTTDLTAIAPYWRQNELWIWAFVAVPLLVLGTAAWSERVYDEETVRPSHAANLATRLQMQAELSAARDAQLRLMPDGPPLVPGLSVAASCTPAREVSGDFYDFLPLANGRLAVVIGEGGNDGLASALTIALTKGYLLYRTQAGGQLQSPRLLLARLERVLGSMLRRESGQTSLALVCIDPSAHSCSLARVGQWPQVLLLKESGIIQEILPGEEEHPLTANDSLVILTDGIAKLLARSSGESPAEVLRRAGAEASFHTAAALHDSFLAAARAASKSPDTGDDITTVVVRITPAEHGHLESAA
jgi:hypothetical protein